MKTTQKVRKVRKAQRGGMERIGWIVYADGRYRNQFDTQDAAHDDAEFWMEDGFDVEVREVWAATPRHKSEKDKAEAARIRAASRFHD